MQRRMNVTLRLDTIDTPARLVNLHSGAVLVYLPPDLLGTDLQLENARFDYRTQVRQRQLRGRPFACAIFHWILPGTYTVRCKPAHRETDVAVQAGVLTQVDWRAGRDEALPG
jgi:hypothetical protein